MTSLTPVGRVDDHMGNGIMSEKAMTTATWIVNYFICVVVDFASKYLYKNENICKTVLDCSLYVVAWSKVF